MAGASWRAFTRRSPQRSPRHCWRAYPPPLHSLPHRPRTNGPLRGSFRRWGIAGDPCCHWRSEGPGNRRASLQCSTGVPPEFFTHLSAAFLTRVSESHERLTALLLGFLAELGRSCGDRTSPDPALTRTSWDEHLAFLIPKVASPTQISEYREIACLSCLKKLFVRKPFSILSSLFSPPSCLGCSLLLC